MSEYTLNDIKFNPAPLTLCPIGQGDNADEAELKKTFQKKGIGRTVEAPVQ